jgi:hypothetical protein
VAHIPFTTEEVQKETDKVISFGHLHSHSAVIAKRAGMAISSRLSINETA